MFTGFAATVSILAALRHRDQTGEGQYCEVSLYETMVSLMQAPMASWLNAGRLMQRTGNDAVVAVPYGVFQGSDAKFVIGVLNDREFVRLAARSRARRKRSSSAHSAWPSAAASRTNSRSFKTPMTNFASAPWNTP
ncbi:MAG: CoA transferase [Alphaproteobacteria bacterium]